MYLRWRDLVRFLPTGQPADSPGRTSPAESPEHQQRSTDENHTVCREDDIGLCSLKPLTIGQSSPIFKAKLGGAEL